MLKIVGISGSLRKGSHNAALLRASVALAPEHVDVAVASIADFPLYNADHEVQRGVPACVAKLKNTLAAADALLLVTPEYNNSLPGVLKNAIDWLSRPAGDINRVFGAKPVALMGATTGKGGTRLAQAAWLPVLRTLGTRPWFGRQLYLVEADQAFDEAGRLADDGVRERLTHFMREFAEFVERECATRNHGQASPSLDEDAAARFATR